MSGKRDRAVRAAKPQSISDEFLRFATFSSIRGVPRSLKSRSWGWSIVWILAVVTFLVISGVFVRNLIAQFVEFNTFYEITNEFQSSNAPFPSVTICNLQPFSSSLLDRVFSRSPISGVTASQLLEKFSDLQSVSGESGQQSLTWKSFFLQNWGHRRSVDAGMRFNEFVLNDTCKFKFSTKSKLAARSCNVSQDVIRLFHSRYFTCFMITPPAAITNSTYSLELDLYLDTESTIKSNSSFKEQLFTLEDSVGGFVAIHTPHTLSDSTHGVHVHPGTKSVIEIVTTKKEEKIKDFFKSPCTMRHTMPLMSTPEVETDFRYKTTVCRDTLTQQRIASACQCKDPDLPIPPNLSSLPFCAQLPDSAYSGADPAAVNRTAARLSCAMSIELDTNTNSAADNAQCPLSCQYISYSTTAYQSLWPPKSNELEFYRKHVANRSEFGTKFANYAKANSLINSGNVSAGLALLENSDLIRTNFLRLHVFRPELSLSVSVEKYQISWEALISQIGGAFSLWAGLTIITLVELLEFVYYVAKRLVLLLRDFLHRSCSASYSGGGSGVRVDDAAGANHGKEFAFGGIGCSIDVNS